MATTKFRLSLVQYMPKVLEEGVLYVAKEFGAAAHLCACGCGEKIRTPIGPTDWHLEESPVGPSLYPSVGNWQKPCSSHYWIVEGDVRWSSQWTEEQILSGRRAEQQRAKAYFEERTVARRATWSARLWRWLKSVFVGKS